MKLKSHNSKALTLLEIILSIGVFVIIATTISLIFGRSLAVYRETSDKNQAAQQAAGAVEWLVRDIQSAYSLSRAEIIGDYTLLGLIDPDSNYIQYNYTAIDQTLYRQACTDQNYLVTEDLTHFSLGYYDINNVVISDPASNTPDLRTIEIDMSTQKGNQEFKLNTVARFDHNPDYFWARTYGGSQAEDMRVSHAQTSDGGYILGSTTDSFGVGGPGDFFVVKTHPDGVLDWAKTYGGSG